MINNLRVRCDSPHCRKTVDLSTNTWLSLTSTNEEGVTKILVFCNYSCVIDFCYERMNKK